MKQDIHIYIATHRKIINPPTDPIYIPISLGAIDRDYNWNYLTDCRKYPNLSKRNLNFCELAALYWAWKHDHDCEISGLVHYRRYFVNENNIPLSGKEIREALKDYDIIINGSDSSNQYERTTIEDSIYGSYCTCHHGKDIDWFDTILEHRDPEFHKEWHKWMYHNRADCCNNTFIARKEIFDEYAAFIFPIMFEMDQYIDLDEYDDYNKRIYGFMSERILYPWCRAKGLKIKSGNMDDYGNDEDKMERERNEQEHPI